VPVEQIRAVADVISQIRFGAQGQTGQPPSQPGLVEPESRDEDEESGAEAETEEEEGDE
jgi:hypothetical protein